MVSAAARLGSTRHDQLTFAILLLHEMRCEGRYKLLVFYFARIFCWFAEQLNYFQNFRKIKTFLYVHEYLNMWIHCIQCF